MTSVKSQRAGLRVMHVLCPLYAQRHDSYAEARIALDIALRRNASSTNQALQHIIHARSYWLLT